MGIHLRNACCLMALIFFLDLNHQPNHQNWGYHLEKWFVDVNGWLGYKLPDLSVEHLNGDAQAQVVPDLSATFFWGALDGPTGDGARDGNFGALMIAPGFWWFHSWSVWEWLQ